MKFAYIPVTDLEDATRNFEQIQEQDLSQPARMRLPTAVALTTAAKIPFSTLDFDLTGMSMDTTNHWYQCLTNGFYRVDASVQVVATAANQFSWLAVDVNATVYAGGSTCYSTAVGQGLWSVVGDVLKCNAGDQIAVTYNGTNGLSTQAAGFSNYFTVMRLV